MTTWKINSVTKVGDKYNIDWSTEYHGGSITTDYEITSTEDAINMVKLELGETADLIESYEPPMIIEPVPEIINLEE